MPNLFPSAFAALARALCIAAPASAARPGDAGPLTPHACGELARQFVQRWAHHVERVYDVDVAAWAQRMVGTFVTADPTNFRNALRRATFEGAMAELNGIGHRMNDQRAVARLIHAARSDRPDATALSRPIPGAMRSPVSQALASKPPSSLPVHAPLRRAALPCGCSVAGRTPLRCTVGEATTTAIAFTSNTCRALQNTTRGKQNVFVCHACCRAHGC